jgi:hypothetical protein
VLKHGGESYRYHGWQLENVLESFQGRSLTRVTGFDGNGMALTFGVKPAVLNFHFLSNSDHTRPKIGIVPSWLVRQYWTKPPLGRPGL